MTARSPVLGLVTALTCGCADAPPPAPVARTAPFTFRDVTDASGIDVMITSGADPASQILEVKGGGLALVDFDGDGDLDLFVPNGATLDDPEHGPGARLFENRGGLRFRDATADAGIALRRWAMGVAVGDVDGDGHDDLYVTCFGPNVLLRNTGSGRFEDVTDVAGVGHGGWSTGAAFGDADGDGDLDLYVANYLAFDPAAPPAASRFRGNVVFAGPRGLPAEPDVYYENNGDGTFRDATAERGFAAAGPAFGLGVVIVDLTGDGAADVFVGNDSVPNFLFVNDRAGGFVERGFASGIATSGDGSSRATMGIAIADVNADGRPDVYTTNFTNEPNTLHASAGDAFFDDATRRYGLGMSSFAPLGWACAFADLDHDGDEDLLVFNGHVYPGARAETMGSDERQRPLLYERDGPRFRVVTAETAGAWLAAAHRDRSAAFGDLDGDGDLDVVVGERHGPVRVLRNDGADGPSILVDVAGTALPSRVEVRATVAGTERTFTRWVCGGTGFLSASARTAHVGLPDAATGITVTVTGPDGAAHARRDFRAFGQSPQASQER